MAGWIKSKKHPGIEYRKHPTRKYGLHFDRYFRGRYMVAGKSWTVKFGWLSEKWTEEKAFNKLKDFKRNAQEGVKPRDHKEERELNEAAERKRALEASRAERQNINFKDFFEQHYLPQAEASKKPESVRKEKEQVKNWIDPVTGPEPMKELGLMHVNKIRANMVKAGRAPRTQQYVMRTFSTVWNTALDAGVVIVPCPTKSKSFKLPRVDNERKRYLSEVEAETFLQTIGERSIQARDMALVALDAGLRFSEIANLTGSSVDIDSRVIHVMNTKGGKDRSVPMTERLAKRLADIKPASGNALVFPNQYGKPHDQVPSAAKRAIIDAQLNDEVEDQKLRASFHSLRHTFGSKLVQAGVDLYRVQKLLGHSTPVVTQRYSHLSDTDLKDSIKSMEALKDKRRGRVIPFKKAGKGEG